MSSVVAAGLTWAPPAHAFQAAVTGLKLTSDSPGTIVVRWDVPAQTPTDYRVNWAKSSDNFPSYTTSGGNDYPTTNVSTLENLEQGVEYKVRMRARYRGAQLIGNQTIWSTPWTEVARITVASQGVTVNPPAAPRGLTGSTTHNSVTLTWNTSNDSSITGYQILRWQRGVHDHGDFQTLHDDTGSAATTYVDTAVEAGERYVYRIKARNSGGLSTRSNYFDANLPNAPATPTTLAPQPTPTTLAPQPTPTTLAPQPTPTTLPPQPQETLLEEGLVIVNDDDPPPKDKGKGGSQGRSANNPATGVPTISGTLRVGETLTADTSAIADTDGLTGVIYGYQWVRTDNSSDTEIDGATSETYTLVPADEGNTIKVTVSFTDNADYEETLTSAATAEVRPIWREAPVWPESSAERGGRSSTDVGDDGVDDYELIPQAMANADRFEIQWWDPICWFTLGAEEITPHCPDAGDAAAQAAEEQRVKNAGIPAYIGTISYHQPTTQNPALILTNLPAEGMYVVRIRAINEHGDPSYWSEYVYLDGSRGSPNANLRWITESEAYGY